MAKDLGEYGGRYSEIVFFAGDDHVDSVSALLDGEFKLMEEEESRP